MSIVGRNEPCPCGSGKKYKKCCYINQRSGINDHNTSVADFLMSNEVVKSDFIKNGVDVSKPGFYDQPAFLSIERKYPKYLNNYARYVETQRYSDEYIKCAEREIPFIAKLLHKELTKDGRLGACIDISMVLSKILEMEGYWNYIVKGALTLDFSPDLSIKSKHYWPIDITNVQAGHVWVSAPPYNVIDITLKQQPYYEGEEMYLPDYVIEKGKYEASVKSDDIFSTEAKISIKRSKGITENRLIEDGVPDVMKVINVFKPYLIKDSSVEMKYITVAITAPDGPLEEMKNLCLEGKYGNSIYKDVIIPSLNKLRSSYKL